MNWWFGAVVLLLLALAVPTSTPPGATASAPDETRGNRQGDVTLYYPEALPKHFRGVRFDWSYSTPQCIKLYPTSGEIYFCGTYEVR